MRNCDFDYRYPLALLDLQKFIDCNYFSYCKRIAVLNVDFSGLTLCFYFEIVAICTEHPVLLMRVNFFIGLGQVISLPVKEITI